MYSHNVNQYQQNHINTASPEQILLMLYDGAIRFTRLAMSGINDNKPEVKSHGITKALAIISEFANSLDHQVGGQIAEDLDALYGYMIRELSSANLNSDLEKLKVVEKILVDLRETWGEAVEIQKKELAAASSRASQSAPQGEYEGFAISR